MKFIYCCLFVMVLTPTAVFPQASDIWRMVASDRSIWKCVTTLSEQCADDLARRPVEELFSARQLLIGDFMSVTKINNVTVPSGQRSIIDNVWDLGQIFEAGQQYLASHEFKMNFGDLEARMIKSNSKDDSVELSVSARRRGTGKSQKLYRVIIPLVVGFKITGLVIFGIVTVKLFLLKAALVANTALLVAGGIVMKKLYDHGMGMLNQHQAFYNSHMSLPNYYSNSHDFSGMGYGNAFESASSLHSEIAEPVSGEVSDLHGGFSNHAIAMAALNKTLQQQQHHQTLPKRRWGHKWSPWGTTTF